MDITLKPAIEPDYTEQLTCSNMMPYYRFRQMTWDKTRFLAGWGDFANFEIFNGKNRVGIIRFSHSVTTVHLCDLQIEEGCQGQGIGSACLSIAVKYAQSHGSNALTLRVFSENPAVNLYKRFGFIVTSENNYLIDMVIDIVAA